MVGQASWRGASAAGTSTAGAARAVATSRDATARREGSLCIILSVKRGERRHGVKSSYSNCRAPSAGRQSYIAHPKCLE
jgi:hypothetical protein